MSRKRWRPEGGAAPGRILLIQLRRIGDAVLITPALCAIREAWPGVEIHLLTSGVVPDLFGRDLRIKRIWTEPRGRPVGWLAIAIRRARFDLVLDFQSIPLTAAIGLVSGAFTVGFERPYRRVCYDRVVSLDRHAHSEYSADHKLDLLRALGLDPRLTLPRLVPPEGHAPIWSELPEGPRVALVPTSPAPHRRWSASAYAEAARLLHRRTGAVFAVVGGPQERASLEEVAAGLEGVPHRLQSFTNLVEYARFLAGADLYLGNDSGPRHLAVGLGIPTLTYHWRENPTHWTPPGSDRHPVIWDPIRAAGRQVRADLLIVEESAEAVAVAAAGLLRRPERG